MKSSLLVAAATTSCARAFVPAAGPSRPSVARNGLLDGVKEAFGAEGMGELDGDRETPIDRWMGWNAKSSEPSAKQAMGSQREFHLRRRRSVEFPPPALLFFPRLALGGVVVVVD